MEELTVKQAIKDTLIIWERLAETGISDKRRVIEELYWEGKISRGGYECSCPLCEYDDADINCSACPLFKFFGTRCEGCVELWYDDWCLATECDELKYYARLFLDQLREMAEYYNVK